MWRMVLPWCEKPPLLLVTPFVLMCLEIFFSWRYVGKGVLLCSCLFCFIFKENKHVPKDTI